MLLAAAVADAGGRPGGAGAQAAGLTEQVREPWTAWAPGGRPAPAAARPGAGARRAVAGPGVGGADGLRSTSRRRSRPDAPVPRRWGSPCTAWRRRRWPTWPATPTPPACASPWPRTRELVAEVQDDGRGLPAAPVGGRAPGRQARPRLGLFARRHRPGGRSVRRQIGPGQGTTVRASVPLARGQVACRRRPPPLPFPEPAAGRPPCRRRRCCSARTATVRLAEMTADPRAPAGPAGRRAAPGRSTRTTALSETLEDEPELVAHRPGWRRSWTPVASGSWARTATWLRSRPPG